MSKLYNVLSSYCMKYNQSKYVFWFTISIIGFIQYLLNHFTPYALDDLHMEYYYNSNRPLSCLKDVWDTQILNYSGHTGRFLSHYLWQLFYYLENGDKTAFNIVNTVFFIALVLLIYIFSLGKIKTNNALLLLIYTMLMTSVEGFGQTMLWMSGSLTYLWMIVISMIFLLPFILRLSKDINPILSVGYFILGILAGDGLENTSIGISILLSSYLGFKLYRQEKIFLWQYVGTAGFLIGTVFLIIAPGNFVRYSQSYDNQTILSFIVNAFTLTKIFLNKDCLFLPLLLAAVLYKSSSHSKRTIIFMLIALFFITYAMCGVSYFPPRTRLASVIVSIVLCSYLFAHQKQENLKPLYLPFFVVTLLVCASSCFDAIRTTREVSDYYSYVDNEIDKAKASGKKMVYVKGYVGQNRFCIADRLAIFSRDYRCWTNADYAYKKGIKGIVVTDFMIDDYSNGDLPDAPFRNS